MMKARSLPSLALLLSLPFAGCTECGAPPPGPDDAGETDAGDGADGGPEVEVGTLVLAPETRESFVDETASFTAFLEYESGERENVTGDATWSLSDETAFELKAPGTVLVLGAGEATITATLEDQEVSGTVTGRAPDAGLVELTVEPAALFLPVDATASVRATALYDDGQARDVTPLATFESLTPGVAALDDTDPADPRVTGLAEGFATVRASFGGETADVDVEVVAGVLEDIEVVPAAPVLPAGGALNVVAIGRYADGELFDLTDTATWTSSDDGVFTASAGTLTGVAAGGGTLTVTDDDSALSATASVTVTDAQIQALEITPALVNVPAGTWVEARVTAVLSDSAVIDVTGVAEWTVGDDDVAVLEEPQGFGGVRVLGVFPASTTLSASYAGETATVDLIVTDAVLESLELIATDTTLPVGTDALYFLVGTFSDGQRVNLTPDATWTSSDPSVALVGQQPPGRVTAVAAGGPVTVTAAVGGLTAQVEVTVTDAALVSLQLNPPVITVPAGEDAQLGAIGIYSDNSQRLVNFDATWASADEQVGVVSNALGQKGRVTGVGAGETTITAQVGELSDTATLRVTDAVVEQIFVTPFAFVLNPGHIEQAQAFATYDNGATLNITDQAVWSTQNASVVAVSNGAGSRGRVTGIAEGQTVVEATFAGVTGSANAFVTVQGFDELLVVPPEVFLAPELSAQLALIGVYTQNNNVRENLTAYAVWTSSDESIATVDNFPVAPGVVTGHAPGVVTISATYQGQTLTRELVVEDVTVEELELSPPNPTLPIDAVQPFVALATFDDGTTADVTSNATFGSSDNTVAALLESFPGVAIALAAGTTELSATVGGVTATTQLTVIDAVPETIVLSPVNPIVDRFEQLRLYATAVYDDGSTGDVTFLCSWTSTDPDVALVLDEPFAKGFGFALAAGTATVTADCGGGLSDTTLVTVR